MGNDIIHVIKSNMCGWT